MGTAARHGEVQRWMIERIGEPFGDECVWWPFKCWDNTRARPGWPKAWSVRLGRNTGAYRVMWELLNERRFPAGMEARHLCGNGHLGCVNPHHVVPGTRGENARDLFASPNAPRGERTGTAKLTNEIVLAIREKLGQGATVMEVAAAFDVPHPRISRIWSGEQWAHVGGPRRPKKENRRPTHPGDT